MSLWEGVVSPTLQTEQQNFTLAVSPTTILPPESGIAGLPQDDFFLNLLISIRSPGRGYYKISRKEVENPFSLISMENTSQPLPPLPLPLFQRCYDYLPSNTQGRPVSGGYLPGFAAGESISN